MKLLTLSLVAYGGAIALSLSPLGPARAQDAPRPAAAAAATPSHGERTPRESKAWLDDRLARSRADGGQGRLADIRTADLEPRLDSLADKIGGANVTTATRPW